MKWFMYIIALWILSVGAAPALGNDTKGLRLVETADGKQSAKTRELVQWTHTRLVFRKSLTRVAVGQDTTIQVEILDSNEVLALAKNVGRTSIMVWYEDGTTENFLFTVIEDLSVLRKALNDIHRNIRIELAPDRAALVLRGKVPTINFRIAAETAARNYLDVASGGGSKDVVMQAPTMNSVLKDTAFRVKSALDQASAPTRRNAKRATIINLIQVETLPETVAEKLEKAIQSVGGEQVTIQRIQGGDVMDDQSDTLLLSGEVESQVELIRVLNIAARMFVGSNAQLGDGGNIEVIANEAGGLIGSSGRSVNSGALGSLGGISSGASSGLGNNIKTNIGRSKMLSVAGGRILSTIEVRDLPQVRVSVQMHEVSRRRLKSWRPDMTLVTNGYDNSATFGLSGRSQQAGSQSQLENALQLLGGSLLNNLQIGGGDAALDLLFALLEEEGISRTVSRPTLTVLAGESAVFRAGGEVPVPKAFAPSGLSGDDSIGANTSGVFSGTEFKSFGVELEVRAMVGENDSITLDMRPTISLPDTQLTQDIAGSTGSALNSAAFNVRTIKTSARLEDGQALVIGGLVSRDLSQNNSHTPGLSSIPLIGNMAKSTSDADSDRELIIIVTPTIIRKPRHEMALWQFPHSSELLDWAVSTPTREYPVKTGVQGAIQ
ncbi:pilus assembly protein N-terminal domain-containing protein [Litorivivens sp.]|uniref:pilus assembly protein N-terminal domain-containing protein n=1 Tax=Litorivivens sp. TaxID=2020868 RepID=UPI0035665C27